MQYSNEVKVGAAIILAVIAGILGVRFFQDLPLFGDSYLMRAQFDDAAGLTSGNVVRMKGVSIGSVESVQLDQAKQRVEVRLRINRDIKIPEGSHAKVSGFSEFGGVRITILPGPAENPSLPPGTLLSAPPEGSVLERLTDQAPVIASRADSVLANTNMTMLELREQLQNPKSDLRQTLTSVREITGELEALTESEQKEVRVLLQNLRSVSEDLRTFMGENRDSLGVAVQRLNQSLTRLNRGLTSFEQTSATLDTLATKLNQGAGTAGRLINDPGLYVKLDSAAARTNRILRDFERNPGRYLDDMTLVRVF